MMRIRPDILALSGFLFLMQGERCLAQIASRPRRLAPCRPGRRGAGAGRPQPRRGGADASAEADNSGQDLTRPLTRLDLRYKYQDFSGGVNENTLTLRVDKPFFLAGGWTLSTRVDLPISSGNEPNGDNHNGSTVVGLEDSLIQAILITPSQGPWAFAFGGQIVFPTGTRDQFTTDKWQLVPTVAAVRQIPGLSPGSFIGVVLRDSFDVAGASDHPHINVVSLQPLFNWALPQRWFVTLQPEIKFDTRNNWRVFAPFDVIVGKKLTNSIVASMQFDAPVIDSLKSYDWRTEARIGFFF